MKKFRTNAETCFLPERVENILELFEDVKGLEQMTIGEFIEGLV